MHSQGLSTTELRMSPQTVTAVAGHPVGTMLSLLADAVGARPQGLPPNWRSAVRTALPAYGREVIEPLFHPATPCFPDCLAASGALRAASAEEQLDLLAGTDPALIAEQLETDLHGVIPALWRAVLRAPAHWLDRYVRLLRTLWTEFRPVWRRARPLLERETDRIGAALVRGGLDIVLAQISPRFRYAAGVLYVDNRRPAVVEQADRPLVLVPLVSGGTALAFGFDLPDLVWIGYPLPGLDRLWSAGRPPLARSGSLAALLGPARTAILRSVGAGARMSTVADAVGGCSPATATYHCDKLAAVGLVARQRQGNEIWVRRTTRGDALLELFDPA